MPTEDTNPTIQMNFRVPPDIPQRIDRLIGSSNRSAFIREAILAHLARLEERPGEFVVRYIARPDDERWVTLINAFMGRLDQADQFAASMREWTGQAVDKFTELEARVTRLQRSYRRLNLMLTAATAGGENHEEEAPDLDRLLSEMQEVLGMNEPKKVPDEAA